MVYEFAIVGSALTANFGPSSRRLIFDFQTRLMAPLKISFPCPHCESKIRVSAEAAGRSGRCPQCQEKIRVPKLKSNRSEAAGSSSSRAASKRRTSAPPPVSEERSDPTSEDNEEDFFAGLVSEGEAVETPESKRKRRIATARTKVKAIKRVPKKDLREQIIGGFEGPIDRVRKTWLYRFGILFVACFVLILPVLYLALIAAAGWGVYWHATENTAIMTMGRGRARIFAVLMYLGPLVAGAIGVLFMLKPLFARTVRSGGIASLNRSGQPLLFEFVDRICETVGAPRPSRIDVDFDVNASASYGSGVLSLVKSDLVLTIGLPLVGGMSLKSFAGILAHEFGHFGQGGAMRVSWIVRSINHWFARVVYERDEWDEWLTEASEETDFRIGWIFWIARMAVGIGRGILWCFMMFSHGVTCWLARQMEFDADRYEVRLCGSKQFEKTCYRLHCLGFAMQDFFRNFMIRGGQPSSGNLVRDVVRHCDELPEMDLKRIRKRINKSKTGLLDTHPADSERIAAAEKENAKGVFDSDLPAEALFREFDQLCNRLMMV